MDMGKNPAEMTKEELLETLQGLGKMMQEHMRKDQKDKVRNYRELNAVAKKGQILFTGSSLMEQFPIAEYCLSAGLSQTVYNRGIGGTTTDDFLEEIDTVLLDLKPSKIFINIGTNDIRERTDGVSWQKHLLENYDKILHQIKVNLPNSKVYLMAYYPVNRDAFIDHGAIAFGARTNEAIDDINAKVAQLAKEYAYGFIDLNDGIKDEQGNLRADITIDGVHIYAGGYASVFEAVRPYL